MTLSAKLLTIDSEIEAARQSLRYHVANYKRSVADAHKNTQRMAHANELAMKLHFQGWNVAHISPMLLLISADRGCDEVMRTLALLECAGYVFDYDRILFDGAAYIDAKAKVLDGLEIGISFRMTDSPTCEVVEETKYEMQPVVTKKLVCG